jgi:serine/threonine-protein kinase
MRSDIARDPEFVAMFLDEAHLSSRIEHPNVVQILDVVAEEDEVFLVMEYVRGESLERLRRKARKRKQPVPVQVAVNIMYGVLAGLHAAHEAVGEDGKPLGIVHRDVSPPNILESEEGIARITDFGIAKAESRLQTTQDGQMKGKIPYMAPEQLLGNTERIDRRIDVFAAGVVLWELLASRYLFRGDHPGETIAKIISGPIPMVDTLRSDVPHSLALCVQKALARDPDKRFSTAEQFADAIEEAMDGRLGSRKKVGAWVKSLAKEELEQRSHYVRQMESTSWNKVENKAELFREATQTASGIKKTAPSGGSSDKATDSAASHPSRRDVPTPSSQASKVVVPPPPGAHSVESSPADTRGHGDFSPKAATADNTMASFGSSRRLR